MSIHPAVLEIARRYAIQTEAVEEPLQYTEGLERGIFTFGGSGLSLKDRKVWLWAEAPVEEQLHEVMHVVTHPPGCKLSVVRENFVLMQVEREMARTLLSKSEFQRTLSWQRETTVSDEDELFDNGRKYWLDTELWLNGYKLAKQLGLLDNKRRPTFQPPAWPGDPVKYYSGWHKKYNLIPTEDVRA